MSGLSKPQLRLITHSLFASVTFYLVIHCSHILLHPVAQTPLYLLRLKICLQYRNIITKQGRQTAIEALKLKVNGYQSQYLKAGSGPTVVLIHGGASDSQDWVGTITALQHRFSIYAPDLIGYGQSNRTKEGYYFSEFSEFILGFIETLGLERPALVGHSFGGRLCLEIALRHPETVRRLVLVDAAGLGKVSLGGNIVLTAFWAMRKLLRLRHPYPQFLTRDGEDTNWLCVDELPNLRIPTLIIWKLHDLYFPVAIARRAKELIPGAHLVVLPGYGHAPHGQNTDAFNSHLLDFLNNDR